MYAMMRSRCVLLLSPLVFAVLVWLGPWGWRQPDHGSSNSSSVVSVHETSSGLGGQRPPPTTRAKPPTTRAKPLTTRAKPRQGLLKFWKKHACQPEPLLDAYFKDLDASGGLMLADLRTGFDDPFIGLRFTIANGSLSEECNKGRWHREIRSYANMYKRIIGNVLSELDLPDMQLVLSTLDGGAGPRGVLKVEGVVGQDLMFIPRSVAKSNKPLSLQAIRNLGRHYPKKKGVALFRGGTTGVTIKVRNSSKETSKTLAPEKYYFDESSAKCFPSFCTSKDFPRYELAQLSRRRPDILDAGFTDITQVDQPERFRNILIEEQLMRERIHDGEQRYYSATIVIDGNSLADRLPRQLAYGIPVVLLHRGLDEFWYKELQPWVHYVPAWIDTLEAALTRLFSMPDRGLAIGIAGAKFVAHNLSENRLMCYAGTLLDMYGERYVKALHAGKGEDTKSSPRLPKKKKK